MGEYQCERRVFVKKLMMHALMTGAVLGVVSSASAVHMFDPPWVQNPTDPQWAGGVTTSQGWEFGLGGTALDTPAYSHNPFGVPQIVFTPGTPQPVTDFPSSDPGGVTWTWHVDQDGGGMLISLFNNPQTRERKLIHLQYTSDKASMGPPITTPAGGVLPGGSVAGHGGTWCTYEWLLEIKPNPEFEQIWIPFPESTNIEEVHAATICVPEPATASLLVCGGFAALLHRDRRK